MGERNPISVETLERLGARCLAELIEEQCERDPVLRKRVQLLLSAEQGMATLSAEIDKRIAAIGRSRSFVDWDRRQALAGELDGLRTTIVETLGAIDARAAAERMLNFVELAEGVLERVDDSSGTISWTFDQAVDDLGELWSKVADRDLKQLAGLAFRLLDSDRYCVRDRVVGAMAETLGMDGQEELKRLVHSALAAITLAGDADHEGRYRLRRLAGALQDVADVQGDVDAFMAASKNSGREEDQAIDIAQRLLAKGRASEALDWVERAGGARSHHRPQVIDLKVTALEALGRTSDAQSQRWAWFQESLDVTHLREYLRRLPDFEDVAARDQAISLALRHRNVHGSLHFFTAFPDLAAADRLVRERLSEFHGRQYEFLSAAAETLAGRYPTAATLLFRRMVEDILQRASAKQYRYAVRDLWNCESLAGRLAAAEGIESHDAFIARLKREHGRKWRFWELAKEGSQSERADTDDR